MRWARCIRLFVAFALGGMPALGPPALAKGPSSRVFVGNVQSGDVSVIDLSTLTVVDTIKLDGRLMKYAKKHKLDPIVAP